MYESGNALRGIFLTAFVALLLFSSFIFCFHLERPDAMTVEPEMTGYYFYHPDIAVFHPSENNAALTAKDPTAAGSTSANSMATGSTDASLPAASPGEWWVNFSTLGMAPVILCLSCLYLFCRIRKPYVILSIPFIFHFILKPKTKGDFFYERI